MIFEKLLRESIEELLMEYKRSATSEEVDLIRQREGIKFSTDKGHPTQRANTVATYRKFYGFINSKNKAGVGLDYSAGLGIGSDTLRVEYDANIDSYEIYPHADSVGITYEGEDSLPNKEYDYIINSAVLNVLPQDIRDRVVVDIWEHLKYGGQAIIGVRSRADVLTAKTAYVIDKETAEVIDRSRGSYQKGFTPYELKTYIESLIPDAVVANINGLSQVTVLIFKEAYLQDITSEEEEDF
jgi:hypothetical protein